MSRPIRVLAARPPKPAHAVRARLHDPINGLMLTLASAAVLAALADGSALRSL